MLISNPTTTVQFDRDREQPGQRIAIDESPPLRVADLPEGERIEVSTGLEITIPFPDFEFLALGVTVTLTGDRRVVAEEVLVAHTEAVVFYLLGLERASILRLKVEPQELPAMPSGALVGRLRLVYGRTFRGAESQLAGGRSEYLKPQVTCERSFGPSNVELLRVYRDLESRLTKRLRDLSDRASSLPR